MITHDVQHGGDFMRGEFSISENGAGLCAIANACRTLPAVLTDCQPRHNGLPRALLTLVYLSTGVHGGMLFIRICSMISQTVIRPIRTPIIAITVNPNLLTA